MDLKLSELDFQGVPFKLNLIPTDYPMPDKLRLF